MSVMRLTEKQLSKLLRYAQQEIWRLAKNLEAAQAELAAGPEDSDTFADPYATVSRPLGTGTKVRFGGIFDVAFAEGELEITGRREGRRIMAVLPRVSNAIGVAFMEPPSHG